MAAIDQLTEQERLSCLRAARVEVKGSYTDRVFHIGLDRRPVTIYTQQVRALRLADALDGLAAAIGAERVAVVGGGIAGLTFAASFWALQSRRVSEGGRPAEVVVHSADEDGFGPLKKSPRYVHPRLFDWPGPGWDRQRAAFPSFGWDEGPIGKTVEHWRTAWKIAEERSDGALSQKTSVVTLVTVEEHRPVKKIVLDQQGDHRDARFDLVVLAGGFGDDGARDLELGSTRETNNEDVVELGGKYWEGVPKGARSESLYRAVGVMGAGDAAITDALEIAYGPKFLEELADKLPKRLPPRLATLNTNGLNTGDPAAIDPETKDLLREELSQFQRDENAPLVALIVKGSNLNQGLPKATPLSRILLWLADDAEHIRIIRSDGWPERVDDEIQTVHPGPDNNYARLPEQFLQWCSGPKAILPRLGPGDPYAREGGLKINGVLARDAIGPIIPMASDIESLRHFDRAERFECSVAP